MVPRRYGIVNWETVENGVEQQVAPANPADLIPLAAGVALFAWWLLHNHLGRTALDDSKPRRNSMTPILPFAVFFVWLTSTVLFQFLARQFAGPLEGWQVLFLGNLLGSAGALATVALILIVAKFTFARGWKGLGLRLRTLPWDLGYGFLTLLAVWPLVMAMMSLTVRILQALDREFEVPQHEALQLITQSDALPLQVLMVVLAVVIAPLVEEMLFRGLFQTMFRSYLRRPWPAILLTSVLFAIIHLNPEHWPALFVLSIGLGYSYEKSGSLLRPILMHALFNGLTIAAALAESAPP
jgi:membrane protease YdiL (CAAX protease family)